MAVMAAAAGAMAAVAPVTAVAPVICKMHRMVLGEPLKQFCIVRVVHGGGGCMRQRNLKTVRPEQASGDEAGDKEFLRNHSGVTFVPASSSGCHSKNPEHKSRSLHGAQAGWYLRFQSEIDAGASSR